MKTDGDGEIAQLQRRFDEAELHADRDTLAELIDDGFLSIGPRGFLLDKTQWIARHDNFSYQQLDVTEIDVRSYGDTVILRDVQHNRATSSGHPVQVATRVSHTWARVDGTWRLAGIQFSPLADQ